MAIRNSYETRSLGGMCGLRCSVTPSATHLPPPIIIQSPSMQQGRYRGERSVSPTSHHCVQGRPRSTSDQLRVKQDAAGGLKRSSSQSSVAVNKTTPTIQTGSSSYVYHTPSGRRIGDNTRRKAYENVRLLAPQTEMKRSSSCSTVTANSTGLKQPSEEKETAHPSNKHSEGFSHPDTSWRYRSWRKPAAVHPQHELEGSNYKVSDAWSQKSKHPQTLKHTAHANGTPGKPPSLHSMEQSYHPHTQFSFGSTNNRLSELQSQSGPYEKSLPLSRFENIPASFPANGVAPHLMYSRNQSPPHITRAKKVQLHAPRGRKVASLV